MNRSPASVAFETAYVRKAFRERSKRTAQKYPEKTTRKTFLKAT